ncbi:MAG: T9SS type A sorting domain-containing protein [Bacteroidota bacterium]
MLLVTRLVACFLIASSALVVRAQDTGTFATGTAQAFLETDQLQVALYNTGTLFFGGSTTSGDGYLVPKHTGNSPVFAASLWLGGKVNGGLRMTAARYGGYDFRPGPLEDAAQPPTDCTTYDRIYTVSRQDVARYLATGRVTDDLRDWPVEAGAPVVDGDGVAGNYNLEGGDQPEILGDVNAFWVMNDVGRLRDTTRTRSWVEPLGVEVRALAFAFDPVGRNALSTPTFYRYEIGNRSAQSIDSLYVSIWADAEIGDAGDDYAGTDTLRSMVYMYNESNEDSAYGVAPPAWGVQLLKGPVIGDDSLGMTSAGRHYGSGPTGQGDPNGAQQFYNYMQGLWADGTPVTATGTGYGTDGPVTRFIFPGDPVTETFWSEVNTDGSGTDGFQGDRRIVLSSGPGRLGPGESVELVYAMPFGQGADHLDSITALRAQADVLRRVFENGGFAFRPVVAGEYQGNEVLLPERQLEVSRVNPNPSSGAASAVLALPIEARVRAAIYDALGRQLEIVVDGELAGGETVLTLPDGLAPGTYLLRVEVAPGGEETLTFTVAR